MVLPTAIPAPDNLQIPQGVPRRSGDRLGSLVPFSTNSTWTGTSLKPTIFNEGRY